MTNLRANELYNMVVSGDLEEFDSLPTSSKVILISRLADGLAMDLSVLRTTLDGPTDPPARHQYAEVESGTTDPFRGRSFHIASAQ